MVILFFSSLIKWKGSEQYHCRAGSSQSLPPLVEGEKSKRQPVLCK